MSNTPRTQPLLKRRWIKAGLAAGVLVAGFIGSEILVATAPKATRKPPEKTARLVNTTSVQSGAHAVSLTGYGIVQAKQQVSLQARISGTVQKVSPKFVPGARFAKGDVLLEIDSTDYRIELQTAQATLAQAQANLMSEQGNQVVAQSDFDLLKLDVNEREKALILRKPQLLSATASVQSAQAAVDRAKVNLDRTVLRAPFDGVVVSREASVGAQVSASSNLGVLASGDAFWISVAIPQADLKWIEFPTGNKRGSEVCVSDASADGVACHKGRVLSLQSSVQDNGRQAQVLIEVPRATQQNLQTLLLSQYVKAQFQGITLSKVFKLDPSLVHGDAVWLNKNNTLDIRKVEVAFRSSDHVLVASGLKDDDEVITSNLGSPVQGMALRTKATPASSNKGS